MNIEEHITRWIRLDIEKERQQLELLESGKLGTGERTLENPEYTDTTDRSIQECRQRIEELEGFLLAISDRSARQ